MKHYRLPDEVDFPDLDDATRAELDEMHAANLRECSTLSHDIPEVTSFSSKVLRTLPAINRAMYKYIWLIHVREYEEFMRAHPELDRD